MIVKPTSRMDLLEYVISTCSREYQDIIKDCKSFEEIKEKLEKSVVEDISNISDEKCSKCENYSIFRIQKTASRADEPAFTSIECVHCGSVF